MEKEKEESKDFADKENEEIKQYKNKVVFLRKSKKGEHLYAFDYNGAFMSAIGGSIIINISDIQALIEGKYESIKISIMEKDEEDAK